MNWLIKEIILMSTLFTLMPYFANSMECNDIRLDEAGSAFERIPVYNQLDVRGIDSNICYAIASSQLIDEYRFRKGDSLQRLSSPLSLAIGFKEYGERKTYSTESISSNIASSIIGGGFIEESILAVSQIEICDQHIIENNAALMQPDSFTKLNKTSAQQFIEGVLLESNSPIIKSFSKLDYLRAVKIELKNKCQQNTYTLGKINVESLSQGNYLEDLKNHMNNLTDPSLNDEQKIKLNREFAQKHDKFEKTQRFQEKVNFLLNQRIPVGIGYLMKVLQKKSGSTEYSVHASVITGQRWNRTLNACELLVRDSYGSNCKDKSGEDRYALPCENGSVWVDAKTLLWNADKITWIP